MAFALPLLAVALAPTRFPELRTCSLARRGVIVRCKWEALDEGLPRADVVATLEALKAEGASELWNTFRLAPRAVSLRELTQTTRLSEAVLDPTATEYSIEDISSTFVKTLVGCSVAAALWAGLAPFDDTVRFTGTYLIGAIPIAILAIGSVAPG